MLSACHIITIISLSALFFIPPQFIQPVPQGPVEEIVQRLRANPRDQSTIREARLKGFEMLQGERYEEARGIFLALVESEAADQPTLYGLALACFNLKRNAEALRYAREAVVEAERMKASEAAANALTLVGVVLAVEGDRAGALAAVKQAVAYAPRNFDAQLALGRAHYGQGQIAEAIVAFRAAVELRPQDARARFFLATSLERGGGDELALQAYRELIKVAPNAAEGHLGVGVLLAKGAEESRAEAIGSLERAIAIDPDLYEARIVLGRTLIRAGRPAEAVEHLQRATRLAPHNPEPFFQLAIAYQRLGKKAEANAQYAIVRKINAERRGGNRQEPR